MRGGKVRNPTTSAALLGLRSPSEKTRSDRDEKRCKRRFVSILMRSHVSPIFHFDLFWISSTSKYSIVLIYNINMYRNDAIPQCCPFSVPFHRPRAQYLGAFLSASVPGPRPLQVSAMMFFFANSPLASPAGILWWLARPSLVGQYLPLPLITIFLRTLWVLSSLSIKLGLCVMVRQPYRSTRST